jgi:chromosome segregation ATPase
LRTPDLKQKLDKAKANVKETARLINVVEMERKFALKKAENAERALSAEADIREEMNVINEELGRLSGELKKANLRTRNLEGDLGERNTTVALLEPELGRGGRRRGLRPGASNTTGRDQEPPQADWRTIQEARG